MAEARRTKSGRPVAAKKTTRRAPRKSSASRKASPKAASAIKPINLALQGGGSHGAFSWGVIDRLLEDERIEIEAVTGASAGAMNAVALADGYADGDRDAARAALTRYWDGVVKAALTSPMQRTILDRLNGTWNLDGAPGYLMFDILSRLASPYDLNPLDINPLADLVSSLIDFERVRRSQVKVFISATSVETGRAKIFRTHEIECRHVMASACLPLLFKAVEIDGNHYWDGGFMGNPALWPLFDQCRSDDVVLVQINPISRQEVPRAARDILNRLNEITFNASLLRELRSIDFVARLMEAGRLEGTGYRRVLVHMIEDDATLSSLGASSKMNAEKAFIDMLFEKGRATADGWLERNADRLGVEATINIRALFQGEEDALDGYRIQRDARYRSETD